MAGGEPPSESRNKNTQIAELIPPDVSGASFSCDLAAYGNQRKMPAVLLCPRGGNLHGPNEWVELSDILDLTCIYAAHASSWCRRVEELPNLII